MRINQLHVDAHAIVGALDASLYYMRHPELPGYTAKFEDVQPGQKVKLYVAVPKPANTVRK